MLHREGARIDDAAGADEGVGAGVQDNAVGAGVDTEAGLDADGGAEDNGGGGGAGENADAPRWCS